MKLPVLIDGPAASALPPRRSAAEKVRGVGSGYDAELPAIYQIEITDRCNLQCPMCLRTTDMERNDGQLPFEFIQRMHERGEFGNTGYVELQMAGEPTLHRDLRAIINYLRLEAGVRVGLSTHGLLIGKKAGVLEALLDLDALTVSVDSMDPAVYAQTRYPAKQEQLWRALELLFSAINSRAVHGVRVPFVELQLLKTAAVAGALAPDEHALRALCAEKGWDKRCAVRTMSDCFSEMAGREAVGTRPRSEDLCLNPWTTVSITAAGHVVSCCFIFEPDQAQVNWYGDLNTHTLRDIWQGERVRAMRESHRTGNLSGQCAACYLKSPIRINRHIIDRLLRVGV